jgi:hypothetical protein
VFLGTYLIDKAHPPVDEDQCDWAAVALDYVREYVAMHGAENLILAPETRVFMGAHIDITGDDEKDDKLCNGTADLTIAHRDMSTCVIIDYKNGRHSVSPEQNPQTMLYGVGNRAKYGKFKKYRSVVIQPRAGERNTVKEWDFTDSMLSKFMSVVRKSAQAALQKNAPRASGPHCTFCKASNRCRTYKDKVWASARNEFDEIVEGTIETPDMLSTGELVTLLKAAPALRTYLDKLEAYVARMLQNDPRSVPDFKLGWGRRERRWSDDGDVVKFCQKIGLLPQQFAPRKLLSPADMEKLVRRHTKPPRAKRGQPPPPSPLEAFVTYTVPSIKVVPKTSDDLGELADI